MLWCYSKAIFFYSLFLVKFQIDIFERFLWLTVALSREMTLMGLQNVWDHKHCFKVVTASEDNPRNYFEHKYYSICTQIKNLTRFLIGIDVVGGSGGSKKRKLGIKTVNGKY